MFAADTRNAYLQAPSSQKDYMICGVECGSENVAKADRTKYTDDALVVSETPNDPGRFLS